MKLEQWKYESVAALEIGQSAHDFHRYRDGWSYMSPNGTAKCIGRLLTSLVELRDFCSGDSLAGFPIPAINIKELMAT